MSPAINERRLQAHTLTAFKLAADVLLLVAGFWAASYIRFNTHLFGPPEPRAANYFMILLLMVPMWIATFTFAGLYAGLGIKSASEELKKIFHSVNMGVVALVLLTFFIGQRNVSRAFTATSWVTTLATLTAGRMVFRRIVKMLRVKGLLRFPMLIVGLNEEARAIARTLRRQPWLGFQPVGFVAANGELEGKEIGKVDGLPVFGTAYDIVEAVDKARASSVLVASSAVPEDKLARLYRDLQDHDVEVRVSAGLLNIAASRVAVEPLDGIPVLALRKIQLARPQAFLKRTFDLAASTAGVLLISPILLAVSLAVKISSPGPVFFRQTRISQYGREFRIFKFRSMVADAERMLIDLRRYNEADGLLFKMKDDPRITAVGRFIRRWSLDELPQLFNVVSGSMSLVGPRPPLPEEVARYDDWLRGRVQVKPGMTGLWQVNGRHELSFEDYVRYDLFYVDNWSIALDLHILWRTIPAVFGKAGSF